MKAITEYLFPSSGFLPTHQQNKTATAAPSPNVKPAQPRILSSCIKAGRKGVVLYQHNITDQNEDRLLFPFLRLQYLKHVGKLISILSLQTVVGIHFVKVSHCWNRTPNVKTPTADVSVHCLRKRERRDQTPHTFLQRAQMHVPTTAIIS
jgi:hypothetical protein